MAAGGERERGRQGDLEVGRKKRAARG